MNDQMPPVGDERQPAVTSGSKRLLEVFLSHQRWFEIGFWVILASVDAWVNALSVLDDYQRLGLEVHAWEPYCWEFSSRLVWIALIPLVITFERRVPLHTDRLFRHLGWHVLFSVILSLLHVLGMVLIREGVYAAQGFEYDFGHWPEELLYEYRKDVMSYVSLLAVILLYRFVVSRIRGEAQVVATGEDAGSIGRPDRLLIRKLGREFVIRVEDIEWIETSGNYMNLHLGGRIYPLRSTLKALLAQLDPGQFVQIHRTLVVNLDRVVEIIPGDSKDATVVMNQGQRLTLSRRYRDAMRDGLALSVRSAAS